MFQHGFREGVALAQNDLCFRKWLRLEDELGARTF